MRSIISEKRIAISILSLTINYGNNDIVDIYRIFVLEGCTSCLFSGFMRLRGRGPTLM